MNNGKITLKNNCWVAPCRPINLVVAQPPDQRKSPETVTETSVVYWIGDLTWLKQKVLEQHHTLCRRWQAGHDRNLLYSGEKEAIIYRRN